MSSFDGLDIGDSESTTEAQLLDGTYLVETAHFSAAFDIENGQVTRCAPILRGKLKHWMTKAVKIK